MDKKELDQYIESISKAMYDIIAKQGLLDQLDESNRDNPLFFVPNLQKLARSELRWLWNSSQWDEVADTIGDAFTVIFLVRDPFKNFKKKGEDGAAPLEQLLHLFWKRQLSQYSQSKIKKKNREVNTTNVNPEGDQTVSEAFDVLVDVYGQRVQEEMSPSEYTEFQNLVDKVLDKIRTKQNYQTMQIIIDMLFLGYSKTDIAKAMGVSPARVSKLMKPIKKAIEDVVKESEDEEFEYLYNEYVKSSVTDRHPIKDEELLKQTLDRNGISINK